MLTRLRNPDTAYRLILAEENDNDNSVKDNHPKVPGLFECKLNSGLLLNVLAWYTARTSTRTPSGGRARLWWWRLIMDT